MAYVRRTGLRDVRRVLAGSALAKGDLLQSTEATGSETVDNAATNVAVYGVALEAIGSAANGLVDRIHPGDIFDCDTITGTVVASSVGKFGDLVAETTVTLTNSNNDVRIAGWDGASTGRAYVTFNFSEQVSKLN
mgnify:CR=1 FL=1